MNLVEDIKHRLWRAVQWMHYSPPGALDAHGWSLFNTEFKKNAPIRYWLSTVFPNTVLYPIKYRYNAMVSWISCRTIDRRHVIKTGLSPGYYCKDTLLLYASFNILVDFVEVELARREIWSDTYCKTFAETYIPFYRDLIPFRNPELGIQSLEWQATLDDVNLPPHEQCVEQAVNAREQLALYRWWKSRENRPKLVLPAYSDQGLGNMACFHPDFDQSAKDFVEYNLVITARGEQEEAWQEEDTAMLIRLAKIRQSLWS